MFIKDREGSILRVGLGQGPVGSILRGRARDKSRVGSIG